MKLFIGDVPSTLGEREIRDALEAGGYQFGQFGIPWPNHAVVPLSEADPQVRGSWRRTEDAAADGNEGEIDYVSWSELDEQSDDAEVLFLRVPSKLKEALTHKAAAEKVSVNEFCARVLAQVFA